MGVTDRPVVPSGRKFMAASPVTLGKTMGTSILKAYENRERNLSMRKLLISILTIIFAMSLVGGDTSAQSPNSVSVGQLYVLQPEWVEVHTAPSAFAPVATKVPQGHVVRVVAGPREVDGLNWWYITPRNYGWVPEVVENIATFELFSNEFMEQTISETNSVLAQDSQNVSALFQRAMAYFALGDHSASIADFDAAIALDNDAAYLYGWRGEVNLDRYTYGDSIADFNEAIALDPTEPNYLIRRGIAREHIYRQYDAEYDYLDAMELVPSYAVPVNNLGNIRRFEGSYTLAISQYEKAMELDPNFGRPYYNRALAKQYQGDYIGALDDYGRALAVDPYDASTYYYRGELLIDYFGNQSAAISDFSNAIELESDFAEAYVARGVAYGLSENYELARSDLEKATELNPNESDGFYNLGSIYAHLGLFEESLTSYEQAMDLSQHWYENGLVYRGQIHLV
ncbi:MAG: tetratricopeptide repeat protein, partial [Anaerolineae bacterium]